MTTDAADKYRVVSHLAAIRGDHLPVGCIDFMNELQISGWCVDPENLAEPVTLELRYDQLVLAEFKTQTIRPDIADALNTEGRFGFVIAYSEIGRIAAETALAAYGEALAAEAAETARICITIKERPLELPRWESTGQSFTNVNLLYVLRSASGSGIGIGRTDEVAPRLESASRGEFKAGYGTLAVLSSEELDSALDKIHRDKAYHLMEGIAFHVTNPIVTPALLEKIVLLALESGEREFIVDLLRATLQADKLTEPSSQLVNALLSWIVSDGRPVPTKPFTPDPYIAAMNAANSIIHRQRALIERLMQR